MRKIPCALLFLVVSCSTKPPAEALMNSLIGEYFYATSSEGTISVLENCSIQTGTKFTIEKVNDIYLFHHQGSDTLGYLVQKLDQNGSEIIADTYADDIDGESDTRPITSFRFLAGDFLTMTQDEQQHLLVRVENKEQYIYHSCEEGMLQEPDTETLPTATIPAFDEATQEGHLLAEFFRLLDPQASHPIYFSEGQKITLESPGPGVYPIITAIETDEALKKIIDTQFVRYRAGSLAAWYNQGLFKMTGLEFRCEPTNKGVFIAISTDPQSKIRSAEISLVDDAGGEPQTQFVLLYQWDENQALILNKIDITDCSA